MKPSDSGVLRALFVVGGTIFLVITVGFFLRMGWATALWPWPVGRLSYVFISSIAAAIAAPMIWIGLVGEFRAARGGESGYYGRGNGSVPALHIGATDR